MRSIVLCLFALVFVTADAQAQWRKSRRWQWVEYSQPKQLSQPTATPSTPAPQGASESLDALPEVNAERAKRGLPAFQNDPLLNQAALKAARLRAASFIHGHLASDFDCLPQGGHATAAGCGALEPSWGWGSCCTYDNYTYAGAAWVLGSDGRRYMHLFVR